MKKIFYIGVITLLLLQSCGYGVIQEIERRWPESETYLYTEIVLDGQVVKTWIDTTITDSVKQLRYDQARAEISKFEKVNDFDPKQKVEVYKETEYETEYETY